MTNPTNPGDRYGHDYGQDHAQEQGGPDYGHDYGHDYGQDPSHQAGQDEHTQPIPSEPAPPPYRPQGGGGYGSPYWAQSPPQGPMPPGPTHASGPLMRPGDGGEFGHSAPPLYPPPQRRPKRSKRPVALLLAAIVAGGLAGVAGAAGYDALADPEGSPVIESLQGTQASSSDEGSDTAPSGSVEAVSQEVLPSVVKIDVSSGDGQGSGSGIILSSDGVILTNNHVVEVAEGGGNVAVSFNDGSTASARVLGTDPLTDIAVIKADDVSGLVPAALGNSASVDVGEQVVAVGSPFGLESTVTSGIVSAMHRPVSAGNAPGAQSTIFPAIQTDAAINPGNSGGALVNMDGEVIGINTAIRSTTNLSGEAGSIGLGFAIPIDEAEPIAQQLVNGEQPTHARLGVTVGTPENEDGLPGGAVVRSVSDGTAAAEAGLQRGDVITKVDDNIISSSDSLVAMVRTYRPGDEVELTVVRNGNEQTITLKLGSDEGGNAS
ncbi:MAG TPA: trypsin-like peptidase domain-containing protein [Nocardioidaceae bacterium]|nr:trypsin-like peptidase domain-containing protein [Nocardioidaceae bacterium]